MYTITKNRRIEESGTFYIPNIILLKFRIILLGILSFLIFAIDLNCNMFLVLKKA